MKGIQFLLVLAMAVVSSCDKDGLDGGDKRLCCLSPTMSADWRLIEKGYSPGAGYIVDEVPASANQYLVLQSDGSVESSIDGLSDFNFFRMDGNEEGQTISFFVNEPVDNLVTPNASFRIILDQEKVKLFNTACIEGCHMGFVPR